MGREEATKGLFELKHDKISIKNVECGLKFQVKQGSNITHTRTVHNIHSMHRNHYTSLQTNTNAHTYTDTHTHTHIFTIIFKNIYLCNAISYIIYQLGVSYLNKLYRDN